MQGESGPGHPFPVLFHADVVLMQREKFETWPEAAQIAVTEFASRGGGIVAVHGAIAAGSSEWGKKTFGGGWNQQESRTFNSLLMLYVVTDSHPIVNDASPFDITDDTLYDLDLDDAIFVLASAFTPKGRDGKRGDGPRVPGRDVRASIYDLQPQMWTLEMPTHRAAVLLQGAPDTLAHASIRSFILRSVAWTAKRDNVDELCSKQDLADLRYPVGGPRRAQDAIKQFKMQPGFTASAVAEEPLISKPIAIQWDGNGRLWVAETPEYANGRRPLSGPAWKETGVLEPGNYDRPARDSISFLEDSNGDGLMDKISPGIFRFRPDGSAIEQVASQGGNSFGGEVTSDLEIFHGKATSGNPIQHVVLPEWVLSKAPNTKAPSFISVNPGRTVLRNDLPDRAPLMQIDQVGRYSAACSTAIYEDGAWPKEYDGTIFTSEPILDTIHMEAMVPAGPLLKGELVLKDQEWLRSMDYWFCPIDVAFGPDGAMYILDFYTPVVAHNDTRGPAHSKSGASIRPDRDHGFGRIYRIQSDSAKKFPIPDLYKPDAAALVAAFRHPDKTVRFNAIRILLEHPEEFTKKAIPALTTMAISEPFTAARIQALWALHRLGVLAPTTLEAAFTAEDSKVRKNAMLIAEAGGIPLSAQQAAAGIADKDARVRLAALRALGASPMSPEVSSVLLASTSNLTDDWSKAAAAAASGRNPSSKLESILTDAANANQSEESARSLAASLASGKNPRQLIAVLQACATSPNPKLAIAVLNEFGKTPPAAPRNLYGTFTALRLVLASPDRELATAALPLAVAWDKNGVLTEEITRAAGELINIARDPKQPELHPQLRTEVVQMKQIHRNP